MWQFENLKMIFENQVPAIFKFSNFQIFKLNKLWLVLPVLIYQKIKEEKLV
jgi:hypothetical protein